MADGGQEGPEGILQRGRPNGSLYITEPGKASGGRGRALHLRESVQERNGLAGWRASKAGEPTGGTLVFGLRNTL